MVDQFKMAIDGVVKKVGEIGIGCSILYDELMYIFQGIEVPDPEERVHRNELIDANGEIFFCMNAELVLFHDINLIPDPRIVGYGTIRPKEGDRRLAFCDRFGYDPGSISADELNDLIIKEINAKKKGRTMRSILYFIAKLLGDFNAIRKGRVKQRAKRRILGKIAGKILRKL